MNIGIHKSLLAYRDFSVFQNNQRLQISPRKFILIVFTAILIFMALQSAAKSIVDDNSEDEDHFWPSLTFVFRKIRDRWYPIQRALAYDLFPFESPVPNVELLNEMLRAYTGDRFDYRLGLDPFTAFEFDHEIVVLNSGNMYGDSALLLGLFGSDIRKSHQMAHIRRGVTHFKIYVHESDNYTDRLLDSYVKRGEVEIIWLKDRFTRKITWHWQLFMLQDCLYRSRNFSNWVSYFDLDEMVTPRKYNGTLKDYLKAANPSTGAFMFKVQWILKNDSEPRYYENDRQVAAWLPVNRYHNTSTVPKTQFNSKVVVDPGKIFLTNVHEVDVFNKGYHLTEVDPDDFTIRHYRDINSDSVDWLNLWLKPHLYLIGNFSLTNYPPLLGEQLLKNVQARLKEAYKINS